MPDLITRERALRNIAGLTSPTAAENLAIDTAIAACSRAIENYCHRTFAAVQRDELYDGVPDARLLLKDYPILSVERVAYDPTTVMTVTNTSSTNQRASVKVTSDGLNLTRVASGVTALNALAFSSYVTLASLKTAIDALGNGWSASIASSDYSNFATADLRAIQGTMNAKNANAELRLHISELSDFDIDAGKGILVIGPAASGFLGDEPEWFGGINYWRVIYTAGYESVPEDVQEASAAWTAAMFWQTKRDPGLRHEAIVGAESRVPFADIPPYVQALIRPYRRLQIMNPGA